MPVLLRRHRLGPLGLLCLLLVLGPGPGGVVEGFNLWPDLPGLRFQSLYKFSNQQHDAHPTHPQPSEAGDEGLSVVDIARRRLWRWAVWRRLYHASAGSLLKQQKRPPLRLTGSSRSSKPNQMLEYTPPRAFELSVPDVGPVTLASSDLAGGSAAVIHLVTRAAAQEQKSLIYVNGTEVSGHLRNALTLPSSTVPFDDDSKPLSSGEAADDGLSLSLHGEFTIHKPAYLHISPVRSGSTPMLWVTQFSLTSRGSVTGIDLFSDQPKEMRLSHAFGWPNEVHSLPPGAVKGSSDEAMLVADGFLMPGRSDGGLYIVQEPGRATEKVTRITRSRTGWFYHKAVWVHDMMGANSRPCVLTARATKPFFGQSAGELVLLMQPDGPLPLAEWNTPWEEMVLVRGPDVMFDVVDLDPSDDIIEVFAAEFFNQRVTLHRLRRGDWRARRRPRLVSSEIIDDSLGPAYSVGVADLKGQGKPSHVLVSSHECQYEGIAGTQWDEEEDEEEEEGEGVEGEEEELAGAVLAAELGRAAGSSSSSSSSSPVERRAWGTPWGGSGGRRSSSELSSSSSSQDDDDLVTAAALQGVAVDPPATVPTSSRRREEAAAPPPPPTAAAAAAAEAASASSSAAAAAAAPVKGGSLFAYEIPVYSPHVGGVRTWKRSTVATGFQVKTWGQINPGAPGFSYVFYPHSDLAKVPGQRPSILLAGDCSHAAYVYHPVGSGDDEIRYELMAEINVGGTVGSLAVAHLPLFGQQQQAKAAGGGGGWAKLFLPNFDTNKVYVFGFGPRRSVMGLSTSQEPLSVPPDTVEQLEAQRLARQQEEEAVLHNAKSYGKARADFTKLP